MSDTLEETASYKIDRFFKAMDSNHEADNSTGAQSVDATATNFGTRAEPGTAMATASAVSDEAQNSHHSNLYEEILERQRSRQSSRVNGELENVSDAELGRLATRGRSPLNSPLETGDAETRKSAATPANGSGPSVSGTPQMPAPLVTKRTTPLLSRASGGSRVESNGHATTPVLGGRSGSQRSSHDFQEALRIDELASKVETLTKVLGEREAENVALSTKLEAIEAENEKLKQQISSSSEAGSTSAIGNDISKYQEKIEILIAEKECLALELRDAKTEIERLSSDNEQTPTAKAVSSSFEFDPNNPATLRRKVEDLQTQIQDLQEANESTAVLLANYQPGLPLSKTLLTSHADPQLMEISRSRMGISDADILRREIESLRADIMTLRKQNEKVSIENERLRVHHEPARINGMPSPNADLQRYERERSHILDEMHRLRQDMRDDHIHSSRLVKPQLRSHSYANLTSFEHDYRSPFMESHTYLPTDIGRQSRKVSPAAEVHQRSGSASRISNDRRSMQDKQDLSLDRQQQAKDEKMDVRSSGSTSSILSDAERELEDMKIIAARSYSLSSPTEQLDGHSSLRHSQKSPNQQSTSAGLRSVSPPPIPTQHNRTNLMKSGYNPIADRETQFTTTGRHPFAPRNAADIHLRDIVKFTRQGGRICKGFVHFVGHLPGRNDVYIGVELEHEDGKHDGTYEGRRYFQCKTNKGVFVAFNKIIMCYGS